jgi:hypothetical protein
MRTPAMRLEELAIAVKRTSLKSHSVIAVVALKSQSELVEAKALRLLGVTLCFLDFPD